MITPRELQGWLLAVYADAADGAVVWLLGEDGERHRLHEPFETSFYIAGEASRLRSVRADLVRMPNPPQLEFTTRRELYRGDIPVLAMRAANPITQERLYYTCRKRYKQLQYYDAKIPFPIRYGAARDVFPMARCRVVIDANEQIEHIQALDSPWEIQSTLPPLRALTIRPDADPKHTPPTCLTIHAGELVWEMPFDDPVDFLVQFQTLLQEYDPDILIAWWGDSWLFPFLVETAARAGIDFNPNRDMRQQALIKQAQTYHSYGDVHFRAAETHLFGRWHIDPMNSMMASGLDFDLHAAIEMARVTCVSIQRAARNSPGAGFTAMQMREALQRGVLVPINKRQIERFKSAMDLNLADSGGLSYRPVVGLHWDVAELDFFSMYPSIMAAWNISGETVGLAGKETRYVPFTKVPITQDEPGLVAAVLKPLLGKRRQVKQLIKRLPPAAPERRVLKAMADGLKWLGYVSFGYQGFKNNLFGNIQAHEAITTIGQEVLTLAKEAAEEMGFEVLGANTDSLFVHKPGARQPEDFAALIAEIDARTGLMIELEGVFQWLAFLPSVTNPMVGVPNRYFGKFYDGSFKVRGTAQRRADTPVWIADAEKEILKLLAMAEDPAQMGALVPQVVEFVRACFQKLDEGSVSLEHLVVKKKLTRAPGEYRNPSEAAKAALQLAGMGKSYQPGQRVPFIYTHGSKTEVLAWDLFQSKDYPKINHSRYKELMLRAVYQLLQPLGVSADVLGDLVFDGARQLSLWSDEQDDFTLADELFAPFIILSS